MGRWDVMAKCSSLLSVCVLASCIVAGTGSANTTGFLAPSAVANHSNTTGPVSQNVSDVKSMLMDLAKNNMTSQDIQNILAKLGADSKTKTGDACQDRCSSNYFSCMKRLNTDANSCFRRLRSCSSLCTLSWVIDNDIFRWSAKAGFSLSDLFEILWLARIFMNFPFSSLHANQTCMPYSGQGSDTTQLRGWLVVAKYAKRASNFIHRQVWKRRSSMLIFNLMMLSKPSSVETCKEGKLVKLVKNPFETTWSTKPTSTHLII